MRDIINKLYAFAVKLEDKFENVFTSFYSCDTSFYFEQPHKNILYVGFNSLVDIKGESSGFIKLKEQTSRLSKEFVHNFDSFSPVTFPVILGGMKFPGNGHHDSKWEDYCASDWFIPEYLYVRIHGESFIVLFHLEELSDDQKKDRIDNFIRNLHKGHCTPAGKEPISFIKNSNDENDWNNLIDKSLVEINNGNFSKVVLSRKVELQLQDIDFYLVIEGLRNKYSDCTLFVYKHKDSYFFGATPEKAASFNNGIAEFDALAGSAPRGASPDIDKQLEDGLMHSSKNLHEHSYVIDYIKEESSDFVDNFVKSGTIVKKLHNIQHLFTHITANMKDPSEMFSLMDRIFPTPAVCGVPKDKALPFILENEHYTRGLYSGVIGWFNFDYQGEFMAALRSALYRENCLTLFAGCGIVKDSDAAKEYEETELKLEPIISLFI